jgi:sec-independent protein translocase protein TatA
MYKGVILDFLNMGGGEMLIIFLAILLLFGGKKLPELARGLGKGIREFKDASEDVKREIHRNINAATAEEELKEENHANRHHLVEDEQSDPKLTENITSPIDQPEVK